VKPIELKPCGTDAVKIELIGGGAPYLGVSINNEQWFYISDRDLWRLERAIKKCRKEMQRPKPEPPTKEGE